MPTSDVAYPAIAARLIAMCHELMPPFVAKNESEKGIELYTTKEVTLAGRLYKEVYFAGVKHQKASVGFYLFLYYIHPELTDTLPAELRKCLKGKTCFHINRYDEVLFTQIRETLAANLEEYKRLGIV